MDCETLKLALEHGGDESLYEMNRMLHMEASDATNMPRQMHGWELEVESWCFRDQLGNCLLNDQGLCQVKRLSRAHGVVKETKHKRHLFGDWQLNRNNAEQDLIDMRMKYEASVI